MWSCKTKYHQFEGEFATKPASALSEGLAYLKTNRQPRCVSVGQRYSRQRHGNNRVLDCQGYRPTCIWRCRWLAAVAQASDCCIEGASMLARKGLRQLSFHDRSSAPLRNNKCKTQLMAGFSTSGPIKLCANRPIFCSARKCG